MGGIALRRYWRGRQQQRPRPGVGRPFRFRLGPQFGGHGLYPVLGAREGVVGVRGPVAQVFATPQPPASEAGRFAVKPVFTPPPGEVFPREELPEVRQ